MANSLNTMIPNVATMSSREIAELTGKDHRNVTRDIEKMLKDIGEGVLKFEQTYISEQNGQEYRCFNLPKNLTLNLIAGYRADLRLKIIDRWMELEASPAQPAIPQTLPEALRLAAEIEEKRIVAEARVKELEPQAEALARISFADGEFGLTEAAKLIQVNPRKFTDYLDTHRWRYTRGKTKLAYQDKIDAGYMRNKTYCYRDSNGEEQISNTIRVTPKGLVKLAQLVPGATQPPAVRVAPEDARGPFVPTPEPAS